MKYLKWKDEVIAKIHPDYSVDYLTLQDDRHLTILP